MTKAQRTLYALLAEQNNAAKNAGEPYLRGERKTIRRIAESVPDEDAEAMSEELRNGAGWEEDPDGRSRMDYILWDLYILRRGIPWEEMQHALLDIFQQTTPFYRAAQNKITNALPGLFETALQMDLTGQAVGQVGTRKESQVFFIIENAAEHDLGTTAKKLLDVFLIDFAEKHEQKIRIPLRQYAVMVGRKTTKNALDALRREVVADLGTLGDIKASYYERNRGRLEPTGFRRLNGGTGQVENGVILWNWNADILPSLEKMAPIDYSQETLTANPRTSTYYFSRYIDVNFRRNEGKTSVNKIMIKTLLATTPFIPDMEKLRAQRGNVRERVINRFFRDLDALERVYYDVYTAAGELVQDPYQMDADEFLSGYIILDYTDYETHPERIRQRKKRAKKSKKAT